MSDEKDPILGNININDLLNLVQESAIPEDEIDLHSELTDQRHIDVRNFIRAKNIRPHDKPIPSNIVYDYYVQWSETPTTVTIFNRYFSIYFPIVKYLGVSCFKVKPESFGMPSYYSIYRDPRFTKKKQRRSRFIGVYSVDGYFIARIQLEDNMHYIGRFKNEIDAAMAYDLESLYHFGKFANLNFPEKVAMYEEKIKKEKRKK